MPNSPIEMLMNTITGKPARPKPARKPRKTASASETKVKEVKKYSHKVASNVVSNVLKNLKSIKSSKAKSERPKPVRKAKSKSRKSAESEGKLSEVKSYAQQMADNVVSNVMKKLGTSKAKPARPKPARKSRKATSKSLSNVSSVQEYSQTVATNVVANVLKKLGTIKAKASRPKPVRKPRKSRAVTMNSVSLNKPVESDIKERLTLLKEQSEQMVGNISAKLKESLKSRKRESAKSKESKKEIPGSSLNLVDEQKKAKSFANAVLKQMSRPKSRALSLDTVKPKKPRSKPRSVKSENVKPMTKIEQNLEQYRLDQKKKFEKRQRQGQKRSK